MSDKEYCHISCVIGKISSASSDRWKNRPAQIESALYRTIFLFKHALCLFD